MRGCAWETRLSPRRQPSVWLHETQLSRDANIKESRLFRFWIIQIYFSDSGRFLCNCILWVINTSYFIFCFNSWLTTLKKVWNLQNALSSCTNKICRFEIIDGVKYFYCIKHAYKFLLREQVGFAAVLWRLRQCVSCCVFVQITQMLQWCEPYAFCICIQRGEEMKSLGILLLLFFSFLSNHLLIYVFYNKNNKHS